MSTNRMDYSSCGSMYSASFTKFPRRKCKPYHLQSCTGCRIKQYNHIRHSSGNDIGVRFSNSIKRYVQHSKGIVFSIIYSLHTDAVGSPFIPYNIDGYTNNHDSTHVIGSDIFVWNTWNATQAFQYTTLIIHGYAASLPSSVMVFGRYMTCRLEGGEMYGTLKEIWITGNNGITTEEYFKYLY